MDNSPHAAAPAWVFARGADHLRIQRVASTRLIVSSEVEGLRQMDFKSIGELLDFQVGYENRLIADGWVLVEFSPERRRNMDRPTMHRAGPDRRRRTSPSKLP